MTDAERALLIERLTESESQLQSLLLQVHDDQWHFREDTSRWNIAEIIEHLVLFEAFVRSAVLKILSEPATSRSAHSATDEQVIALRQVGEAKIQSREAALPKGTLGSPETLRHLFQRERAKTIALASSVEGDLRSHHFQHLVLGDLDAYQWLLVIPHHTERHIAQMKTLMSHPDFPK